MVSLNSFLTTSVALIAAFITVEAAVSPTYPSPGTIQTEGQAYNITWTYDGKDPSVTYQIDFMTGSNDVQTVLSTVATKVDPSLLEYTFVAPKVTPHAAIYFFMFTGSDKVSAWTTRFGIVGSDGKLVAEPEQLQPNGDKIPWGNGQLASGSTNATTSATSSDTTGASVVPAAASAVIASSSPVLQAAAVSTPASISVVATVAPVASSPVSTVSSSPIPSVAQVAAESTNLSSGASMVKPALTLVSAAIVGYFAL